MRIAQHESIVTCEQLREIQAIPEKRRVSSEEQDTLCQRKDINPMFAQLPEPVGMHHTFFHHPCARNTAPRLVHHSSDTDCAATLIDLNMKATPHT